MQQLENKLILNGFKNYYCDALSCAFGEFIDTDKYDLNALKDDDLQIVCDYAVLKNKMAGVSELYLKVPNFGFGVKSLEKFNMNGKEIIPAEEINVLPTSALVGERLVVELPSLIDYNQSFLSDVSDFVGSIDCEILIKLGQDLEEVGKIVNKFKLSPAETLESFGFLDRKCYAYGLNFIDKEDQKLLKDYDVTCIFSPLSDAEEGLGAINLYNFIYNDLKFGFSSGKCYNINMLWQAKLAKLNTSNLMYQNDLIEDELILENLQSKFGHIEIELDKNARKETVFDKNVLFEDKDYLSLREKVKQLAIQLKEKN